MRKILAGVAVGLSLALVAQVMGRAGGDMPQVLGLKEQAAVTDGWLEARLDRILLVK